MAQISNLNWATGLYNPVGLAINGAYLYVANNNAGTISQVELATGNVLNLTWATGFNGPFGLVINGAYLYVACGGDTIISQVELATGNVINPIWATGLSGPFGLVINGPYMYASNAHVIGQGFPDGTTISKIDLATGNVINANWAVGLFVPTGLVINGPYMYAANLLNSTISQIDLATGTMVNLAWASGFKNPLGLAIYGSSMYVSNLDLGQQGNPSGTTISQVELATGKITNLTWAQGLSGPTFMYIDYATSIMYVSNINNGNITTISLPPLPPLPISNICFPAGTPIKTDQGFVSIEQLNAGVHTLASNKIAHITQTVTLDKYLVAFEKNSIERNIPSKKTVMSKDHKILYKEQLVPAYRFLDFSKNVTKVAYAGETLYNVLLAEHGLMEVNNLVCETLHPENIIAQLYTSNLSETYKNNIIVTMNSALQSKDMVAYKSMVNRLN